MACCSSCNKDGCTLLTCSACKLPDACYCSKECQKNDWKRHKRECKLAKQFDLEQTNLILIYSHEDTKNKDYDAILRFAKKYMKKVTDLKIRLRQAGMWTQEELGSFSYSSTESVMWTQEEVDSFSYSSTESVINFSYEVLRDYLESVPLVSFELTCENCIQKYIAVFTRHGKAFEPLTSSKTLRRFEIANMAIKKISYLPLSAELESLRLWGIKFTSWDGPSGWQSDEVEEMISLMSRMTNLKLLSLTCVPISDEELGPLLSNLGNLRNLEISGTYNDYNISLSPTEGGQVTDEGCKTIARLVPNLQCLKLHFQYKITKLGASVVLKSCDHLREICCYGTLIKEEDLYDMMKINQSLLYIDLGYSVDLSETTLTRATKITGGRTVIYSKALDLREPKGLSNTEKKQWLHSKQLLMDLDFNYLYNEWEPLWGVNVAI